MDNPTEGFVVTDEMREAAKLILKAEADGKADDEATETLYALLGDSPIGALDERWNAAMSAAYDELVEQGDVSADSVQATAVVGLTDDGEWRDSGDEQK